MTQDQQKKTLQVIIPIFKKKEEVLSMLHRNMEDRKEPNQTSIGRDKEHIRQHRKGDY